MAAAVLPALPIDNVFAATAVPCRHIIFDERHRAARTFANNASAQGLRVSAIAGDVTALWYHGLQPAWRNAPAAIAGLTRADSLFVLEQLAWDVWMRVVHRAPHAHDDALVSWLIAPRR